MSNYWKKKKIETFIKNLYRIKKNKRVEVIKKKKKRKKFYLFDKRLNRKLENLEKYKFGAGYWEAWMKPIVYFNAFRNNLRVDRYETRFAKGRFKYRMWKEKYKNFIGRPPLNYINYSHLYHRKCIKLFYKNRAYENRKFFLSSRKKKIFLIKGRRKLDKFAYLKNKKMRWPQLLILQYSRYYWLNEILPKKKIKFKIYSSINNKKKKTIKSLRFFFKKKW